MRSKNRTMYRVAAFREKNAKVAPEHSWIWITHLYHEESLTTIAATISWFYRKKRQSMEWHDINYRWLYTITFYSTDRNITA